jgi:hypothetical protein
LPAPDVWMVAASDAGLGSTALVVIPQGADADRVKTRFIPRRRSHRRRRGVGVSCRSTSAPRLNRAAPDGRKGRKKLRLAPSVPPRGLSWRCRGFPLRRRVPKQHRTRRRRNVSMWLSIWWWCQCHQAEMRVDVGTGLFSFTNRLQGRGGTWRDEIER